MTLSVNPAHATEQSHDTIAFAGTESWMLERPLNDFLGRSPKVPRFDIPSTANYKGYTATWEIKDSRLYLATFQATINRKPYSILSLFPGRKLPLRADWYSGTLHIISGRVTRAEGHKTYERVAALKVTNGVVISETRLTDV